MNAQDIWNTYRKKFQLTDTVCDMIIMMRSGNSNILAKNMESSGLIGMEMLLHVAYHEQQYDLCKFLLENGAESNSRSFIPNPSFTELNTLLSNYKIHDDDKESFYQDLSWLVNELSTMSYTRENVGILRNIICHSNFH